MLEWLASAALMVVGVAALMFGALGLFFVIDWRERRRRRETTRIFDRRQFGYPDNDNFGISPADRTRDPDGASQHMASRLLRDDDRIADDPLQELAEIVTRGGGVVAWRRPDGTLEPYEPERRR
jgi:hypothetical protein